MPRAGLTRQRVVAEAGVLADESGLARLTMAELAQRLGVRLPSLYKHVDGMDGLQRDLAISAKTELAEVLARSAVGKSREQAITSMCHACRSWATAHPGRYSATVRAAAPGDSEDEAAGAAVVAIVLDVLSGFGLSGDDAIDAVRVVRASLHGFISLESDRGFGLPNDVDRSFDRLVAATCRSLAADGRT